MPLRLTIPGAFYPPAAPLGRWVQRRARDVQHAESLTIIAVALVFTVATLASQWSWILLGELAIDDARALGVLVAHVVGGTLLAWTCLWGWRPAVTVEAEPRRLVIARGEDALDLDYRDLEHVERITAAAYHRHWRRYAATQAFVNRLPTELLLLRTTSGPVVLGLAPDDLDRLDAYLAEHFGVEQAEPFVRAA